MDENTKELSWVTREHDQVHHGVDWYWTLGIIAVATLVGAILLNNTLFGVLIVLAAGLLAFISSRPPAELKITITERGIFINDFLYPYSKLKSFWVDTDEAIPLLIFMTDRLFVPMVSIPIDDVPADDLRLVLRTKLKEVEMHESRSHKFMETLGF